MAIEIKVCRDGSSPIECSEEDLLLNWGQDISDALICSEEAAVERGRVEIDKQYTNRKEISISVPSLSFVSPGSIFAIDNPTKSIVGMVNSISIQISREDNSCTVGSTITGEALV